MDKRELKPAPGTMEQLALGLEIDEGERNETGYVSPDEARRRSMTAQAALHLSGEETPAWFDQYQALMTAGWPWRVACYIAWAGSPRIGRWPKTQEDLATQVLGLTSARRIATWRQRNPAIDEMIAIVQAAPLMEHRADVLRALAISAADPDYRHHQDRKLFLEIDGTYTPKVELKKSGEVEDLSQLSEEELARMERALRPQNTPQIARMEEGEQTVSPSEEENDQE
jgi:hypothetical protein